MVVRGDIRRVVVRAEGGVEWTAAFADLDPAGFPMLWALTPYGDAVFNQRQVPRQPTHQNTSGPGQDGDDDANTKPEPATTDDTATPNQLPLQYGFRSRPGAAPTGAAPAALCHEYDPRWQCDPDAYGVSPQWSSAGVLRRQAGTIGQRTHDKGRRGGSRLDVTE
jgi:hypothetical protein